jgi:ferredoxin
MNDAQRRARLKWKPNEDQMKEWPDVSGNAINGLGETEFRRPAPIYWHPADKVAHGPVQTWFYKQPQPPEVAEARKVRQQALDIPIEPVAPTAIERTSQEWSALIKQQALALGAETVGITRFKQEWVFEGHTVPQKWIVVLGIQMSYEASRQVPGPLAAAEIHLQYARGIKIAKQLANWLHQQGHDAFGTGGPMAGSFVMIPAALEAGLGELGKHGSIINRKLGSTFRLACVLTDLPLISDQPDDFGADDFCTRCRLCMDECPPDAILPEKSWVRGEKRWYVDFDKCLPYFTEHLGCGICIAVCPWSRPGVADNLLVKMAVKREQAQSG